MDKIAGIRFYPWDQVYNFDASKLEVRIGDQVVVETKIGQEIGEVVEIASAASRNPEETDDILPIIRVATKEDLDTLEEQNKNKDGALKTCREEVRRLGLEMKLTDVQYSFDGNRLTFAFTADGRVDFRELVKNLARLFQKSIRLHQIGSRDEARQLGCYGNCGRELCCRRFKKGNIESITTDMARLQQLDQRGSARLSGACGRLMCCLSYEAEHYEDLRKNLPQIGATVKTKDGKTGNVVDHHVLKQSVMIKDGENTMHEVPVNEIK